MRSKLIIALHGLGNKPPERTLSLFWRASLREGLRRHAGWGPLRQIPFSLVYWSPILYPHPLHRSADFADDENYDPEPFLASPTSHLERIPNRPAEAFPNTARRLVEKGLGNLLDQLPWRSVADYLLSRKAPDLAFYRNPEQVAPGSDKERKIYREVLQKMLRDVLWANHEKDILLIAHSMGSIIAYDVLQSISKDDVWREKVKIPIFVTIGSPLGLTSVRGESGRAAAIDGTPLPAATPEIVSRRWVNLSDPYDPVVMRARLGEIFRPNSAGIQVEDERVETDYISPRGEPNYHKSFGYLRTQALAQLVAGFLDSKRDERVA